MPDYSVQNQSRGNSAASGGGRGAGVWDGVWAHCLISWRTSPGARQALLITGDQLFQRTHPMTNCLTSLIGWLRNFLSSLILVIVILVFIRMSTVFHFPRCSEEQLFHPTAAEGLWAAEPALSSPPSPPFTAQKLYQQGNLRDAKGHSSPKAFSSTQRISLTSR